MNLFRLSPSSLPTRLPLNTVLWWLLAIKVYEMPGWLEGLGWMLMTVIVVACLSLRAVEQHVDIFDKYRERKDKEHDKPA